MARSPTIRSSQFGKTDPPSTVAEQPPDGFSVQRAPEADNRTNTTQGTISNEMLPVTITGDTQ